MPASPNPVAEGTTSRRLPRDPLPTPLPDLPLDLPESKFQRPEIRPGIVPRSRTLARVAAAGPVPLVSVVAPPGYGKSTLLAQWAELREPNAAWISCDAGDNDPTVLLTCLAAVLVELGALDPAVLRDAAPAAGITAVPALTEAIDSGVPPGAVVLDHLEEITNRECHDVLMEFVLGLPPGWQVVVASRHALPLPVARLRAQGRILEIGARDLAMSADETSVLLEQAGLTLDEATVRQLAGSTEGWPVAVYLTGLGLRRGSRPPATGTVEGSVSEYLRTEILHQASEAELTFLTRTSVLRRLSGGLCDATLEGNGSARILEELEQRNLLVVPLDRHREWYRYHHLFRDVLETELERREPGMIRRLHARAAAWFEANGLADEAIEHAQAAGDSDRAARIVLDRMQPVWASGRVDTVLRWVTWFEREGTISRYPEIALHGALILALLGRSDEAERWAAVARQAPPDAMASDGSTMGGLLAYLRAIMAQDGVAAMGRDARIGFAELAPTSPYRATMLYTEGMASLLEDDLDQADPVLAHAERQAAEAGALPLVALVLGERCVVASERDDWGRITQYADRALAIIREGHFEDYWTSALPYAWAARAALYRGDAASARRHAAQAARLRPLLVHAIPVMPVQALLELARAYVGLGDPAGADAALQQAEDILRHRPDLGPLPARARQLRTQLRHLDADAVSTSALTTAELRLLPLLRTHLSLEEIGERLHVARSTVKTQTKSIYRKLGVSSRGEAVSRSRELGIGVR